jgi:hypothetical protein
LAHLTPSIEFVINLKSGLEQGNSLLDAFNENLNNLNDPFSKKMALWFAYYKNSMESSIEFKSQYQKNLLEILDQGFSGAPVYEHLCLLEKEMSEEFERQWKAYLESLPLKLSLPLLFFFFPSYVILLFGPLIVQFLTEVSL